MMINSVQNLNGIIKNILDNIVDFFFNNNKKKVNARHTHDHRIDRFQTNTTTSK